MKENIMSETSANRIDLELVEKILKIANLQADTELKNKQSYYLPWQVIVPALAVGVTAGVAICGGIFTLFKMHFGG